MITLKIYAPLPVPRIPLFYPYNPVYLWGTLDNYMENRGPLAKELHARSPMDAVPSDRKAQTSPPQAFRESFKGKVRVNVWCF